MITQRKKNTRQRGSVSHGWGSRKKHRGAGHRGGRGMSGSGKRGDQKKESILGIKNYFGKHGFTTKRRTFTTTTNIRFLEDKISSLVKEGKAKIEDGVVAIDLADIGVDKLLSKGNPDRKYMITCKAATPNAISAIEKAGGKVIIKESRPVEEKPKKPENTSKEAKTGSSGDDKE